MAIVKKRLTSNVPGEFYVDSTCIDCDACRQLVPEVFEDDGYQSFVLAQPQGEEARRKALRALLACPTGSIGTAGRNGANGVIGDFPLRLEDEVYYCGFNSEKSYGGNSYFVRRPDGNWLMDSPRYVRRLAERLDELGGVDYIFLTHRDDVADAERYARRFGGKRIIHAAEAAAQRGAEIILEGGEVVEPAPGFLIIPTPGHTRGHCVLLYDGRFLFSGDHLSWERETERLRASRHVCWYSWPEQTRSMARLCEYSFEWVLPGHGQRVKLPSSVMQKQVRELVERM